MLDHLPALIGPVPTTLAGALVLCGLGAWLAGRLLKLHDDIWASTGKPRQGMARRLCGSDDDASGCERVRESRLSKLKVPILRFGHRRRPRLGAVRVPLAFLALAYFMTVGVWFLTVGTPDPREGPWHLPILATVSSAAPMLGFLGTVSGMINSFDDIVRLMGDTNIVEAAASGISEALLTTCFGLIVGIPAFVAYNYFTSVINRFVLDVEESATELIETVTLQIALE